MTTSVSWETAVSEARPLRAIRRFAPVDKLIILYAVLACCEILYRAFGSKFVLPRTDLAWLLVAHMLLVFLVWLASEVRRQAPRRRILAEWYPLLVLVAVYMSVGVVNAPQALKGISYDPLVQHWEVLTFGREMSVDVSRWQGFGSSALAWPLSLSYLFFFPLVHIAPLALWLRGEREEARQTIFGIALAFFICYLAFLLFPVAGPQYLFDWPASTGWPARTVQSLINNGDSWGSAFPSSHVAASMTAALLALRHWRKLGYALLPFAIGIVIAVVYFQMHYAIDAVAGLLIAALATWSTTYLFPLRPTLDAESRTQKAESRMQAAES